MIHLKSDKEIKTMQEGGKKLRRVLDASLKKLAPGVSTLEIDQFADSLIQKEGGEASFKRINGYHWATCMCVNDCVVHGIPKKDEYLKEGDVVSVDVGMYYKGFHTDTSWTVRVGRQKTDEIDHFLDTGEKALDLAIQQVKVGNRIGHISQAIQNTIEPEGYSVAKELIGHGIGKNLHEDPEVPGLVLRPIVKTPVIKVGMLMAIEAIYMMGDSQVVVDRADGWTIRTKDGTIASCYEKTIAVTGDGVLVLT